MLLIPNCLTPKMSRARKGVGSGDWLGLLLIFIMLNNMENARNWVNGNSQSAPFDLVSSCDEAAHIVATIQADVLRFAAAEIRRSGYTAEYVLENMAKDISRGFLPPNAH